MVFPGVIDFGEGVVLHEVYTLLSGGNIYPVDPAGPFMATNYSPLYYLVLSAMMGPELSFAPMRLLSIIGCLMVVLGVGMIVYHYSRSLLGAIAGGFLTIYSAHMNIGLILFGSYGKADAISTGFTILGFAFSLTNLENRRVYLGIPFFVLGLYFKQTAIIAPAVLLIFLFLKEPRRALLYFVYCVLFSAAVLLYFSLSFELSAMIEHMITYNSVQEVNWYLGIVHHSFFFIAENLPGILLGILCYYYTRDHRSALFFALAYVFFIPSMGKRGSLVNYWIQPDIALLLMVGIGLARAMVDDTKKRPFIQALILICGLIYVGFHNPKFFKKRFTPQAVALQNDFNKKISDLVGDKNSLIFAAQPGLISPLGGRSRQLINDPFLYNELVRAGKWDDSLFVDAIRNQKFTLILLDFNAAKDPEKDPKNAGLLERVTLSQSREILKKYTLIRVEKRPEFLGKHKITEVFIYAPMDDNQKSEKEP